MVNAENGKQEAQKGRLVKWYLGRSGCAEASI
jgi:hypothetical protein